MLPMLSQRIFFPVLFTIEVDHRNNAPSPIIVRYSSL